MSHINLPSRVNIGTPSDDDDPDYWYSLISEKVAADFLDLAGRTLQKMRQEGRGPKYVVVSVRCIRYRRVDLKVWVDSRLRKSTADPGEAA